jgi:transcription termination factor Rho
MIPRRQKSESERSSTKQGAPLWPVQVRYMEHGNMNHEHVNMMSPVGLGRRSVVKLGRTGRTMSLKAKFQMFTSKTSL